MSHLVRRSILPLVYFVTALALYAPALRGELILDDWGYITENPWITTTASPWLFWTRLDQIDYYPLTYTWYWVAWRLFGENTLPYHLTRRRSHSDCKTVAASIRVSADLGGSFGRTRLSRASAECLSRGLDRPE
jgi:hypothetical protein